MRLNELTRAHEWWDHKTPQVLSMAYATALLAGASMFGLLAPAFLMIFASLIAVAIYASIINDYTDLEIDRAVGKSNMMDKLQPIARLSLVLLSLCIVGVACYFIYPNIYGLVFYLLIILSISLYSFAPFRLKNRGILGVISCASAEHLFPTLFAVAIISYYSAFKANAIWLAPAGTLSFLFGVRSILWHQFLDRENDRQSGMNTYATGTDPESFRNKSVVIVIVELIALSVILFQVKLVLPVIFLVLYLVFIMLRKKIFKSAIVIVLTPKNSYFQILMLDYYALFFPLSLLICAALVQPLSWIVLVIHVALFYKPIVLTLKESLYLIKTVVNKVLGR
jgi:4-hydroxybenzoate polyprenyltransferase